MLGLLMVCGTAGAAGVQPARIPAGAVRVTILSTMLSGDPQHGIGEWGFAALLEADERTILIDTGARPEAVHLLRESMGLSRQTAVVGAVGASFTLKTGINPLGLAR
jgi:7,8-dihydropterin-6-yl-methyl-4-(beta-D-ribofuranosyl)aminobenzene 5'-phosphate synthase